jgi:hypothetical protein
MASLRLAAALFFLEEAAELPVLEVPFFAVFLPFFVFAELLFFLDEELFFCGACRTGG